MENGDKKCLFEDLFYEVCANFLVNVRFAIINTNDVTLYGISQKINR